MYCVWDIMFDELRRVFKSRIEYKYDGSVNPFVYFMRERDYRRLLESVWIQPSIVAMHRDGSNPLIDILASQCPGGSYHPDFCIDLFVDFILVRCVLTMVIDNRVDMVFAKRRLRRGMVMSG